MELRNKCTGRVLTRYTIRALEGVDADKGNERIVLIDDETHERWTYYTLAAFNDEWEDYEEPETYYIVGDLGNIESSTNDHGHNLPEEIWHKAIKRRKEIGNYFETKEEAEKAVEKLKAWKRLKDKGIFFEIKYSDYTDEPFTIIGDLGCTIGDETKADLDLLFGGEE